MAVELVEGFDLYNGVGAAPGVQAKWTMNGSLSGMSMETGRFGGKSLRLISTGSVFRNLAAGASKAVGMALRPVTIGAGAYKSIFNLRSGNTYMVGLSMNSTGDLCATRQTATTTGTVLATAPAGTIVVGNWHYIECEIFISDTVGIFKVWVDGVLVINLTNVDTRNGTPTTVDQIQLNCDTTSGSNTWEFDDLYIEDTGVRLGEQRVETLAPVADVVGATDWVPSTGVSHFATVDEATASVADYNSASVVGNTDRFTPAALSSTPATISAVQVIAFAQKTDAASRSIALQVKSGATTSDGPNFALNASPAHHNRLMLTDPATGVGWTPAAVNALQFGAKVTV